MISPAVLIDITPQTAVIKKYRVKLYTGSQYVTTVQVSASDAVEAGQMVLKRPWYKPFTVESIERIFPD